MVNLYVMKETAADFYDPQSGVDSMVLLALTDGKEAWYGIEIDKKKYGIVLEDETEDSVYLKIVKKEKE